MNNLPSTSIEKNRLNLSLRPVFIGQLIILSSLNHAAYCYIDGEFKRVVDPYQSITSELIKTYAIKYGKDIFINSDDYKLLSESLKSELTKLTRSLSIGDPLKNGTRHVNLLSLQMENLYRDPFNDELLTSQFQNTKNLSNLLINNKSIHKPIYQNLSKQSHHFIIKQPLLTAIMLVSYIQQIGLFSEKEIQNLFLTSYFKDIGLCFIPREKFNVDQLSDFDKQMFQNHAYQSTKILEGRVPLSRTQLAIIQNHHIYNEKLLKKADFKDQILSPTLQPKTPQDDFVMGVESVIVSCLDILVAMTTDRPYRKAVSPFKALELIKHVTGDEYQKEFKTLVFFIRNFYGK